MSALLVCLIPTTIGGLLSAIGIAGMDRVMQHNVLAMSGKAVEAAGDVNTLLLDKTGTITLGNRQAVEFMPVDGVTDGELADAAQLSSLADETPEGRSVVVLAKEKYGLRGRDISEHEAHFHSILGLHADERRRHRRPAASRKGATDAIVQVRQGAGRHGSRRLRRRCPIASRAAAARRWPWPMARRLLGVIHLKDIVKGGMKERIAQLRAHGHPLRDDHRRQPADRGRDCRGSRRGRFSGPGHSQGQARIHQEGTGRRPAGRDDRRRHQRRAGAGAGRRRPGDEHRHDGRQEAGNMVDLDSNPTKLIEVVAIGKQLLITRGALTTFSIANDVAKYFAIIPAMFMTMYPALGRAEHHGPAHAAERGALRGDLQRADHHRPGAAGAARRASTGPSSAAQMLRRNLLIYGVGGIIAPFPGIWLIDRILGLLHLA